MRKRVAWLKLAPLTISQAKCDAVEALPPLPFVPVRVRSASGLGVEASRQGDYRMLTWSERGNVYWLVSDHGNFADLVRLADSLR